MQWVGLKSGEGQNIELGVLLVTSDPDVRDDWLSRIPAKLPDTDPEAQKIGSELKWKLDPDSAFCFRVGKRDPETGRVEESNGDAYRRARARFFTARGLAPHLWPGGPNLPEEEVRGVEVETQKYVMECEEEKKEEVVKVVIDPEPGGVGGGLGSPQGRGGAALAVGS